MDRKYIDDHHIVARYLADQLSDTDREAFEAYYLCHPEVLQEMEAAAQLKVGLQDLSKSGQLNDAISVRRRQPSLPLTIAATIALGVAIGLLLWRSPVEGPVVAARPELINPSWKIINAGELMRMRSGSIDPLGSALTVDLPAADSVLQIRVLPEFEASPPRYRTALRRIEQDQSMRSIGELGPLAPNADGFISIFLDSTKLQPGYYELILSSDTPTGAKPSSKFLLKLVERKGGSSHDPH